ncbi:50S ribosomal protein L18 [candidate division WWE3 bacterium RBG_19FT_COMBO_34_6]|uniref:Large ribosomal subunit protein uL18 n=1 Tax=candidate division WWE3 bacterium RBG_19FT_COMBO_34_6 TaxID=1802612 RepID=A0A1F4UJY0_UNCKA|nr:MAG: 50S ribosomal protein L18 [candidate division WWE3 bacterium RBG_19FT_COMBO_34_6]
MPKVILRKNNREKRKMRVRKHIFGTAKRPRLSIYKSNKYEYAQLINDETGKTVLSVSFMDIKKLHKENNKTKASFEMGKILAQKAKEKNIKTVVFDRNGYKYHGRVKSLADGVREGGIQL